MLIGLDEKKLKSIAKNTWQLYFNNTLVKLLPFMLHNNALSDDEQYPPGYRIPQWKLIAEKLFQITRTLEKYPTDVYS